MGSEPCPWVPTHQPPLGSSHTALLPHPPSSSFNMGAQGYCMACLLLYLKHAPPDLTMVFLLPHLISVQILSL